jgi:hypothetical protein
VDAIYTAMLAGGFLFDAKNDATARRSMAISLAKNSTTFHRLPNGDFGLLEWYPNIPARTKANGKDADEDEEAVAENVVAEQVVEKADPTDINQPYQNEFAAGPDPLVAAISPPSPAKPGRKSRKESVP